MKKLAEAKKEDKKRLVDEEASKRIRHLEEQCSQLQKQARNEFKTVSSIGYTGIYIGNL